MGKTLPANLGLGDAFQVKHTAFLKHVGMIEDDIPKEPGATKYGLSMEWSW